MPGGEKMNHYMSKGIKVFRGRQEVELHLLVNAREFQHGVGYLVTKEINESISQSGWQGGLMAMRVVVYS